MMLMLDVLVMLLSVFLGLLLWALEMLTQSPEAMP
jgi:hypothetical protein